MSLSLFDVFILGGNGKQQEENEESSCIIVVEDDDQQEENSCIIVEAMLSPSSEPAHQTEGTTLSEFELGMAASSRARQVALDSPIKAPKVTDEFSQDSFPSLSIIGMSNLYMLK